jgi:uncharacterized protein YeaO (DUF488 family)
MLFTKSIQDKKSKKDGIRICIMRRIRPEFEFDIWIPNLAPSTKLLKSYHDKRIDWKKFEANFVKEVLEGQRKYVEIIAQIADKADVTILCWEAKDENCHRFLVADRIKKINSKITLKNL